LALDQAIRDRAARELIAEALRTGHEVSFRVRGSSMLPSIWPGDEVAARALDAALPATGEIVVFVREGRLFAHRVVGSSECGGKIQLLTRGDALAACDRPVDQSEVLGAVVKIARDGRQIPMVSRPNELISIGLRHSAFLRRMALKIHAARHRSGINAEIR
jgi:signal peptidase I